MIDALGWVVGLIGQLIGEALCEGQFPWLYRGWLYLFLKGYREDCQDRWLKEEDKLYKIGDITLSVFL